MKTLLFIFIATFSLNIMAKTTVLACTDLKTEAIYILRVGSDSSILIISALTKDSSVLGSNVMILDLEIDRSSETDLLYAGRNSKRNIVVAEVKNKQLINGKRTKINIYYSEDTANLTQEVVFDCKVNIDERYKRSEKGKKSKILKFNKELW